MEHSDSGTFVVERGVLRHSSDEAVWALSTLEYDDWLQSVESNRKASFEDIGHVRVGIKTTADEVFIRSDWEALPANQRPEAALLRPLITHVNACRWVGRELPGNKRVLYPHTIRRGRRAPVELDRYPAAAAYLERHRGRLSRRRYVVESGRRWYEIWVPHNPTDWSKPKLVYPDISVQPKFFVDTTGAIVNGDCYWITLKEGRPADWLYLMLAVANSSFMTRYYDIAFHNKLYSGRRRFMAQYIKNLPLPDLMSGQARRIVQLAVGLVGGKTDKAQAELEIDALVWKCFGLDEKVAR